MAKRRAKKKKKKEPFTAWTTVVGVLLIGLSLFCLLSLVSYDPNDVNGDYPANMPAKNLCGQFGAHTARLLIVILGLSSGLLAALVGAWGGYLTRGRLPKYLGLRIVGSLALVLALAAIDGLTNFAAAGLPSAKELAIMHTGPGGKVGGFLAELMEPQMGFTGSLILLIALFCLATVLAADRFVYWLGAQIAAGVVFLFHWTLDWIVYGWDCLSEWRTERAERRAEEAEARAEEAEEEYEEDEEEDEEEEPKTVRPAPKPKRKTKVKITIQKPVLSKSSGTGRIGSQPMLPAIDMENYALPSLELLEEPAPFDTSDLEEQVAQNIQVLEQALTDFGIDAHVVKTDRGPVITLYALELAPGVKVHKILALSNDLSRALKSTGLRIQAPIPNTPYVGIEIPNETKEPVRLKEILSSPTFDSDKLTIPIVLGKDAAGVPIVQDLAKMPHLLIAGTTGAGKSVCLNSIILSILFTRYPSDVKLLLVDPKMVELAAYRDIPHLLHPVITDMKKAPQVLEWAVKKMDDRYEQLARTGCRNIAQYNRLGSKKIDAIVEKTGGVPGDLPYTMAYVVIIIDELADLMMTSRKEVETHITRLAQKSRAIGIHIILATQRPSTDVITGLIKSNISARVAFRVFSKVDSRVILDSNGAETLLGQGDMLFLIPGTSTLVRAQGSFVSDPEILSVTDYIKTQATPQYSQELQQWGTTGLAQADRDELFDRAAEVVIENQRGSVSLLQRVLAIGYTRASRLMEQLAAAGIVGEFKGAKARPVLLKPDEYLRMKEAEAAEPND